MAAVADSAAKKPRNAYLESDEDMDSDDSMDKNDKELDDIVKDIEGDKVTENAPDSRWTWVLKGASLPVLFKMKASVREWGETSSCHGIPHMAQASTLCAALVWSVILAFCAVGFVYLFSDTLRQYLRFDKIVKLNLGLESTNFPSITFCNINPYKMSKIQDVPELQALLTVYESSANGTLT